MSKEPQTRRVAAGGPRRVARIAAKILAACAAIVVVPLIVGVGFLRTERGHEILRRIAVAQARKAVPGLEIGRIEGGLVRDVSLRDVDLRDDRGQPAIHLDRLSVRYHLLALLHHEVVIDDLQVQGLRVVDRPDARGGSNLEHLTLPGPANPGRPDTDAGRATAWTVSVAHALIDGASAEVGGPDGQETKLTSFHTEAGLRLAGDDVSAWIKGLEAHAERGLHAISVSLGDARVALNAAAVSADVRSLKVGGLLPDDRVLSVAANASGPRERVAAHVDADADTAGRVRVDATFGLPKPATKAAGGAATFGAYTIALNVIDLDPAGIQPGAPAGRISLSARARGEGQPLSSGARAGAEVALSPSDLAGVHLLGGQVRATIHDDEWQVERSELRATGASVVLSGHGQGRRLLADTELTLDGALVRGRSGRIVRGHGNLSLHAEGTVGQVIAVRGHAGARDLRFQSLRLGSLALELTGRVALPASHAPRLSARVAGRLVGLVAGEAQIGHATLDLDVDGTPDAPTGHLGVVATQVVAARGAPSADRVNLRLADDHGRLSVQASARGPRLRAAVSARGMATATAGDVTLDQLALDVTTSAYRQQLTLMEPARVRYETGHEVILERTVLKGAGARFTGQATVEGAYRNDASGRAPSGHVALELVGASTGGLAPVNAKVQASVTPAQGSVHLSADMPSAAAHLQLDAEVPVTMRRGLPRAASHGATDIRLTTSQLPLQAIPVLQRALAAQGITGGTATLTASATGDIAHPEAHAAFDLKDVMYRNIVGLGRDSTLKTVPGLGGSLKVDAKDGSVTADAELLIRNAGVLELHAALPIELRRLLDGADAEQVPLRATVKIPTLRLASLADFSDGFEGIDGQLHGTIDIKGTLRRPSGEADITVDDARVDKLHFKQTRLHAVAGQGTVRGQLVVEEAAGGRLEGSLSLDRDRGDSLEASVTGKDLDVSFARLFLSNVREVAGVAQISATARGTLEAPQLWASLSLTKGRLGLTGQPTFRDLLAEVTLKPGRLDLHDLKMSSGDGYLQGKGWATLGGPRGLTPQAAVFTAHAHRFLVALAGSGGARVDGDLAFDAALRADVLAGKVNIPNANIWLPKTPSATGGGKLQKVGQHADVQFVDATAQAAAQRDLQKKRQAASAALRVAFQAKASPVYVRGKDMDIEVRSNVEIGTVASGPHRGAVTLGGAVHIPRGRISIQGQRFDFDHGDITFDGSWDVNPALDIKLTRQFPDALVVIELRGTPRKPQLHLSSDPGVYDQAQIVSLILTGQAGGQPSNGKGFDPTSVVATAVLSQLADQVAPQLGLDVMRVEKRDVTNEEGQATGDTDTRVEVGKYVTQRIYLSYAHIFGAPETANQNEAHVEYRMTRRWVLETIFGDAGQGGLDALWTYKF